jgi:predicted nucleic acid-binding protein
MRITMADLTNEQFDNILLDLNAVVISILADHPGHDYLFPPVEQGFEGMSSLLVFDYYPFRAQYLLTKRYDIEEYRARNAVQRFVRQPIQIISAEKDTILNSYEVSSNKNHDVYDSFLIALARQYDVDAILTADEDFDELCHDETFRYFNPVPSEVLEQFADIG